MGGNGGFIILVGASITPFFHVLQIKIPVKLGMKPKNKEYKRSNKNKCIDAKERERDDNDGFGNALTSTCFCVHVSKFTERTKLTWTPKFL